MPKLRLYQKKEPFRDSTLFVIICEGGKREYDYFDFFNGMSSRIVVRPVPSEDGRSAPNHLLITAKEESAKKDFGELDQLWFVLDTDRWMEHIHTLRKECEQNWFVAQSNPCFEVWLYCHFEGVVPARDNLNRCSTWKALIPEIVNGGFSSDKHPLKISVAITNAEAAYQETGYTPEIGSTQVYRLGKRIVPLIEKELLLLIQNMQE